MASPASRALLAWVTLGLLASFGGVRCAAGDCGVNSDCGPRRYCDLETQQCRSDCVEDRDCEDGWCDLNGRCQVGTRPDAGPVDAGEDVFTPADAGPDVFTPVDTGPPPVDVPVSVDMGPPPVDVPIPVDMGPPPVDVPTPVDTGPVDTGPPPVDVPPPIDTGPVDTGPVGGPGAYLDPCTSNADCMLSDCVRTDGGGFCSRGCSRNSDCGDGMICDSPPAGIRPHCVFDDIGRACNPATPNACARYCFGTSTAAHCTRECLNGGDCPAGYGCQSVATSTGSVSVCIEIERPCTNADQCPGGICLVVGGSFRGCSAPCRTQAECPVRMTIPDELGRPVQLPRYSCGNVGGGTTACVPPLQATSPTGDILGSDPLGVACSASGAPTCYSGVCFSDDVTAATACVQRCTPQSGCPVGFACKPLPDISPPILACQAGSGRGLFGSACTRGADCVAGLCFPESSGGGAFCTRYCNDGVCPTGMRCTRSGTTIDGLPVSLCLR